MNKAFFFDRDGVLNKPDYRYEPEHRKTMDAAPISLSKLKMNKNARKVIDYVRIKGFIPIIITNQPDFLKKKIYLGNYEQMTTKICWELGLKRSQVFECFHKLGFSLECDCRKPKPGLILMAKGMYDIDLADSWLIGDRWQDISAAENAGIENTIFLKRKKIENIQNGNEQDLEKISKMNLTPRYIIANLLEVIDLLK